MLNYFSPESDSAPLIINETQQSSFYTDHPKRLCDILLSLALLPFILPVLAILYLIVRRDGGPGFFGHNRVGRNGEVFKCWKIRTMVIGSQERLDTLLANDPVARSEWTKDRKLTNDPRITRFGNFLRKSSLDELPQLLNVLRGEMSLVGPRPVTASEVEMYGALKAGYLRMRPGVSGIWQVSGRNDISYNERVKMDWYYAKSVTLGLDLRILGKTVGAVLNRTGR